MKYTVGSVPYLNAKPLVRWFEDLGAQSPVHVLYDVPSKLPAMLDGGSAQAIMVSSIEALRHPGTRVAAGVCIGSQREVLSVRLFSKVRPEHIRTLALDRSSMTSNALAQIVLRERFGLSPASETRLPCLADMLEDHDACVLIGDNGMREQGEGLHVLDLGEEWFRLKGLPFVWAVWLGGERLTSELAGLLASAQAYGQANLDRIATDAPAQTDLPLELCDRYLRKIMHYPMGERELEGLREFGAAAQRLGLIAEPHFPTLVSADVAERAGATRRDLLAGAAALAVSLPRMASPIIGNSSGTNMDTSSAFLSLLRPPDLVRAFGARNAEIPLQKVASDRWEGGGAVVTITVEPTQTSIRLTGDGHVGRLQFRWRGDQRSVKRYLGDHWERSYGDLEWRGVAAGRAMPWYFLAFDGNRTHGYGVRNGPGALCFWNADPEGISLWADVRSGGVPVVLAGRTLDVAQVLCREGRHSENAFKAGQAFCRQMCPAPRLPGHTVYGTNDWNYAYGNNSAKLIEEVGRLISDLSPSADNRPYSVIDDGWAQSTSEDQAGHGPWFGNPMFGDMGEVANRLKGIGLRPGLWFRPLIALMNTPASLLSRHNSECLDPTVSGTHEHVATHIRRFVEWGYEMIKHDYSTYDICGHWGSQMGASPTSDGWHFQNSDKTTAEVITGLYATLREAAGDAKLIGCNTMSHLATGFHEVQRTGDDTSGRSWNRNRRMGVNTLGFRGVQHGAFYTVDPDIVAITKAVPWTLVDQWLRLVSQSGVALFVAIEPSIVEPKHRTALRHALEIASKPQIVGEPLDWMDTDCPRRWNLLGKTVEFEWMGDSGNWPFGD